MPWKHSNALQLDEVVRNAIKEIQPDSKVILGNSVGGSIPEVVFQTTKVDIVIYGEAEITITKVLDAIKNDESFGEILEPLVEYPMLIKVIRLLLEEKE